MTRTRRRILTVTWMGATVVSLAVMGYGERLGTLRSPVDAVLGFVILWATAAFILLGLGLTVETEMARYRLWRSRSRP